MHVTGNEECSFGRFKNFSNSEHQLRTTVMGASTAIFMRLVAGAETPRCAAAVIFARASSSRAVNIVNSTVIICSVLPRPM